MWGDIVENELVGAPRDDRAPALSRKATAKIPLVKEAFNAALGISMLLHKLGDKVSAITRGSIKKGPPSKAKDEYDGGNKATTSSQKCRQNM
jgi:hypothetical protein